MTPIRVLIADDQSLIRSGLSMVIGAAPDMEVVGEAIDGVEAVALAESLHPDVVLLDVQMPRLDGIEATHQITSAAVGVHVIILTTFDNDTYAFGGIEAGASGFLLKDSTGEDILSAVRAVAAGDAVLTPRITAEMIRRLGTTRADPPPPLELFADGPTPVAPPAPTDRARDLLDALTDREREVFDALAEGLSNAEIAEHMWLSESTVKTHVGRVLAKLGMRDRVQVVVFAFRSGLL